ncbi:efflux RND transporter periplasmic adaptor subunit, partial [bacterium]|nr:efflux RND transporter periplasmic adaptor subunit [bacterium]
ISGPLEPIRGATVSTQESGVLDNVPNDRGARVEGGDLLVVLDRNLLAAEKDAAEAGRKLADHNESKSRKLFEAKQISRQEMLRIEAESAQARATADVTRERWERAAVKAPFAGIVAERYAEIGEFVPAGTPVARVVDPYTLEVRGAVSEREAVWLRAGADATVTMDGTEEVLSGRVHWISVEAARSTGKFPVEVRVANPDLALRPGIVARAQILKRRHDHVIVIPRDAVLMQSDGPVAFVADGKRAVRRRLELGADQGLMVAVLSGLDEGELLIVRGQRQLHDGSAIKVQEHATALDGSTEDDPDEIRGNEAFLPLTEDDHGRSGEVTP